MAIQMFRPIPVEEEPKLQNRFVLEFPTELGIDSFLVSTFVRPKRTTTIIELPYMNSYSYVAGHVKWEQMEFTLIDVMGPSTAQKSTQWGRLQFEETTGRMGYAVGAQKNLVLKMVDPVGVEIEKWTLVGCTLVSIDYGTLDYGSDEVMKITMVVQPFQCVLAA